MPQFHTVISDIIEAATSNLGALLGIYTENARMGQYNARGSLSKGIATVPQASPTALTTRFIASELEADRKGDS